MNRNAKVAVITRTLNRPTMLKRAVASVLAQTWTDWQHVIVNDGGTRDEVDAVVQSHRDQYKDRVTVVHHSSPLGMEAASNKGISESQSRYVLIHDDDDTLEPGFLSATVNYLDAPGRENIAAVASHVIQVDERIENGRILETSRRLYRQLRPCISIDEMARVNSLPPISMLFRRSAYEAVGPFDETLPVLGDWDFNIRLISKFDIGVIPHPLANYHLRPSISGGELANTLHAKLELHRYYDTLVRNRYLRSEAYRPIGILMQRSGSFDSAQAQLSRLYRHPVIGRCIRIWARLVNPSIPLNVE